MAIVKACGWPARDSSGLLSPFKFSRRHEIVGVATEIGRKVKKVKVGDKVGVGPLVDSCRTCQMCTQDQEGYCPNFTLTYSSIQRDGSLTYGGYSDVMVADERFVLRWPDTLPLDSAAPLLCAGSTTYSSLIYYGLEKPGLHIGVVGLGGLGHVALKFLKAFGTKVTVISTSESKREEAIEKLGADAFLLSSGHDQMKDAAGTMDGIIDTVSSVHPIMPLLSLVKSHGKLVLLGAPHEPLELASVPLILALLRRCAGRKTVSASGIGGLKETQAMLDFAAEHNIMADVEVIPIDYVNTAMERLHKGDVRYRFVIDVGNSLKST